MDITCIQHRQCYVYLTVIVDVFTRRIPAGHLNCSLDQCLTVTALYRALSTGDSEIRHPDQNSVYSSHRWTPHFLLKDKSRRSYVFRGAKDNPEMQSFNGRS